jgi:hypothetical protein
MLATTTNSSPCQCHKLGISEDYPITAMTSSSGDEQTDLKGSNLALITNVELRKAASGNKIQL